MKVQSYKIWNNNAGWYSSQLQISTSNEFKQPDTESYAPSFCSLCSLCYVLCSPPFPVKILCPRPSQTLNTHLLYLHYLPIHPPDYPKGTEDSINCTRVPPQTLRRSSCHPMRLETSHFYPILSISSARVPSVTGDKDILPSLRDLIFARLSNLGLAGAARVKLLVFVLLLPGRFGGFVVFFRAGFVLNVFFLLMLLSCDHVTFILLFISTIFCLFVNSHSHLQRLFPRLWCTFFSWYSKNIAII